MYKKIKALLALLTAKQRKKLMILQLFVVMTAFSELISVATIGPFMALVGDINHLNDPNSILSKIYIWTGISTPENFLVLVGVFVLSILALSTIISIFTSWKMISYGTEIGAELSNRLYRYYMSQPWLFHASGNSSDLINKIAQESGRVTNQIIQPLIQLNAKFILAFVLSVFVFSMNPLVAFVGVTIFAVSYISLYKVVRLQLSQNGIDITSANKSRFKLMNEGFGGIKDTLLFGRQDNFNIQFEKSSYKLARSQAISKGISQIPRYAMQFLAFSLIIFLVLFLVKSHNGNLGEILPILSMYALAGFKFLPAFQEVYTAITKVRANIFAFDSLEADLINSNIQSNVTESCDSHMMINYYIELKNIDFSYPNNTEKTLDDVNIKIPKKHVIGFVGPSGSGKSTIIDIILGLIHPDNGFLMIDNEIISEDNCRKWQNSIGFVAQSIYLCDASIKENIAFGINKELIDNSKVLHAASMAQLDELINQLPEGMDTQIGERGVQLSGGQRQRIGIARALYNDASVLIFDEATSALDGMTEKLVMDAINNLAGNKTIIMIAHRLSTVKGCDSIYVMKQGKIVDAGSYDELVIRNPLFKQMANL